MLEELIFNLKHSRYSNPYHHIQALEYALSMLNEKKKHE